jgi:hypothetical protein
VHKEWNHESNLLTWIYWGREEQPWQYSFNLKIFKVSADIKSETDETQGVITYVNYRGEYHPTLMIDTPGFGDTEERDFVFTARMILCLKSIKYVNAFIVCLNSQESRIDLNKQGYIKLLGQIFGG